MPIDAEFKTTGALFEDPKWIENAFEAALKAGAEIARSKITDYPPPVGADRRYPIVSQRQRNFLRWAISNNIIDYPYRRGISPTSQRLGQSWTIDDSDKRSVTIGTNVGYARFVQDRDNQSLFHKETGWKTVQDVVDEDEREIVEAVALGFAQSLANK